MAFIPLLHGPDLALGVLAHAYSLCSVATTGIHTVLNGPEKYLDKPDKMT